MFMKQYNYKPRSGSQSGGTSGSAAATVDRTDNAARADSPPKVDAAPRKSTDGAGAVSGAIAGRRRSSDASGKFAGLSNYKRNSQDEGAAARKASWAEQSTAGQGILGGMWNSFTKGK